MESTLLEGSITLDELATIESDDFYTRKAYLDFLRMMEIAMTGEYYDRGTEIDQSE